MKRVVHINCHYDFRAHCGFYEKTVSDLKTYERLYYTCFTFFSWDCSSELMDMFRNARVDKYDRRYIERFYYINEQEGRIEE